MDQILKYVLVTNQAVKLRIDFLDEFNLLNESSFCEDLFLDYDFDWLEILNVFKFFGDDYFDDKYPQN